MGRLVWIGVDPGDVTGVAFLDLAHRYFAVELPAEEASKFIDNVARAADARVQIGCEQYVERGNQRKTHQPAAQRVTGAVQALGHPVQLIQPATAKKMCTNERLLELGWYERTKDGHKNDAGRVLFATIATVSPSELRRLIPST